MNVPRQPFGPEVNEVIQAAVVPSDADVMAARSIALELACQAKSAPRSTDILDEWLRRSHGLTLATVSTEVRVEREPGRWRPPAPDSPGLVKIRGTAAVATAIAQLLADGLLLRVHGDYYGEDIDRHVSVSHAGGGDSVTVRFNYPVVDDSARWRPAVNTDGASVEVLDAAGLVADLDDLLGSRGIRTLNEAHAAYRRRLWLAAAALLATASEAAWFALGRRIATPGTKLATLAAEGEDAAKVHSLTSQRMRETKLAPESVINDVTAIGAHLRDIRNYALHPGGPHEVEREPPFTEAGCTALFMASRRYFVKLAQAWSTAEITADDKD